MPRRARAVVGGYAFHILNRANCRLRLFKKAADFQAFEQVLAEVFQRVPLRILAYTLMGNHWHFVVWPKRRQDGEVSDFFRRLSVTHSMRWHAHHGTLGMGHVYQGRFKSFPIEQDEHRSMPTHLWGVRPDFSRRNGCFSGRNVEVLRHRKKTFHAR